MARRITDTIILPIDNKTVDYPYSAMREILVYQDASTECTKAPVFWFIATHTDRMPEFHQILVKDRTALLPKPLYLPFTT